MKKYILAGALMFSGIVGVFAISNSNSTESSEEKALLPCRMHVDSCPSGYYGGYHCSKGLPTLPACVPEECDQISPCKPGSVD